MPDFVNDHHLYHNPVEFVLDKIGGTYKMPILWRLKDDAKRYTELKKSLSQVSDRMLTKSLKELESDGFVKKEIYAEIPPRVEYSLTNRGINSIVIITELRNYGFELMKEFGIEE